jgi:O-methyltransferase
MMEILSLPKSVNGCIVEAGCYKGGSTAKFSMAANLAGRSLVVFDSFRGIPPNDEQHGHTIFGTNAEFPEGDWCGSLNEVKQTIRKFGSIECCEFVDGWFEDTMPSFRRTVAAIYLDVDLADSTRTCLKYLHPQLVPGGAIYSQDGHLPLVLEVFDDPTLWREVLHAEKPAIDGFGKSQLISLRKSGVQSDRGARARHYVTSSTESITFAASSPRSAG